MADLYCFPLKQHIGAPCVAVVKAGERVLRGQRIADVPAGKLGAHLHTSVSGVVKSVTAQAILIFADAEQSAAYLPIQAATIEDAVREAGIVGLGGAGFPSHEKLRPLGKKGVVIANCAECEPVLGHNIHRIEKTPQKLVRGLALVMAATGAERGIVLLKEKHQAAIAALRPCLTSDLALHLAEDIYPSGEERAAVRDCLGVLLAPESLPAQAEAVVFNAETLCRIAEAVDERKPLIDKDLTIGGRVPGGPHLWLDIPLGTPVEALLERAGGVLEPCGELLMGGPFTGKRVATGDALCKTSGGILVSMPPLKASKPLGLLVCGCGPTEARMRELAADMGAPVVAAEACKQAQLMPSGALKCLNPGRCPGQAERVLRLQKAGAGALLVGNCSDCTNTVMAIAPKLGLGVHHVTDGIMRAAGLPLIRRMALHTPGV